MVVFGWGLDEVVFFMHEYPDGKSANDGAGGVS